MAINPIVTILALRSPVITSLIQNKAMLIILCLLVIEIISYLLLPSFKKAWKQITETFKSHYALDFIAIIFWILLFIFNISQIQNNDSASSMFSYTFLSAGLILFVLGWLFKYYYQLLNLISKIKSIRPFLNKHLVFRGELKISYFNSSLYGPWLEIIGLSLIAKSFAFYPALFIFPVIMIWAISYKARKLAEKGF